MDHSLYSCDTLVALGDATKSGNIIFAKNSDRGLTEAQPLELSAAESHGAGAKLKCTHITIDQAPRTCRVIGSRPWWIWGFEHGVNEYGVVIGNEAAGSQIPEEETDGLIGMDLLRLGLERGNTAEKALGVITGLLERHGQGGSCSYGTYSTYHNLFMIADQNEAWILETVNRHWAAKKVKDYGCISNIYSIGADFDKCSDGIAGFAVSAGIHAAGREFDFAKSFSAIGGGTSGFARAGRMRALLGKGAGDIDVPYVKSIMRDHFEGEIIAPQWSPAEAIATTICMHAARPERGHTAASAILELYAGAPSELAFTYWGCMCPPCLSFYIPIFNTGYLPSVFSNGETNKYSPDSFWWKCFRLALAAEADYEKYFGMVRAAREPLEAGFREEAEIIREKVSRMFSLGAEEDGVKCLNAFTDRCVAAVTAAIDKLTAEIERDLARGPGQVYKMQYIKEARELAGMLY